jgi:hypothetical protein
MLVSHGTLFPGASILSVTKYMLELLPLPLQLSPQGTFLGCTI